MSDNEDSPTDATTETVMRAEVRAQALASILSAIQEHRTILSTFHSESDRGAILVAASFLDSTLERLLRATFVHDGGPLVEQMFSFEGPMGAFSARINMALAMGLIHTDTAAHLHRVRRIRNACAHSPESVDFDTDSVRDLTNAMWHVDSFVTAAARNGSRRELTRARFLTNAIILYAQLFLILRDAKATKREQLWLANQMSAEVARDEANPALAAAEARMAELERAIEANLAEYAKAAGITIDEARARLDEVAESARTAKVEA
jgi:DNA-binding MltR family transcriptional regulator